MTNDQAKELVDDLIQSYDDYETFGRGRKSYREHYNLMKQRVIDALVTQSLPQANVESSTERSDV